VLKDNEENDEYFTKNEEYMTFFDTMNVNEKKKKKEKNDKKKEEKKKKKVEKNTPAQWEETRDNPDWLFEYKLPLKTLDGSFIEVRSKKKEENLEEDSQEKNGENGNLDNEIGDNNLNVNEDIEKKEKELQSLVIDDPELAKAQIFFERQKKKFP